MSHLNVFFNNHVFISDFYTAQQLDYKGRYSLHIPYAIANFALLPIRCLFDGNSIEILCCRGNEYGVIEKKEYNTTGWEWDLPKRTFLRVVASIVFLVPGLILGTLIKGGCYISSSAIRKSHHLAVLHYTPIDRVIGSETDRLTLQQIRPAFIKERDQPLHQPTNTLTIYAQENTIINTDPGILDLNPKKVILVGARLVHEPSALSARLDDTLRKRKYWETKSIRSPNETFVKQYVMNSVEEAKKDLPPYVSFFSFERYKRIYCVN